EVDEACVGVVDAGAVAGEVLHRRQDAGRVHAGDVRARLRGHELGVGAERAADTDAHGVGRVVADVDHRRQVPVDAGVAQHAADAPRLQLGRGEVARLAGVLVGEGRGPDCGRAV